ncbi:MAG: beta-propeller fold lactonase family protein, partial [Solimonas sp.]
TPFGFAFGKRRQLIVSEAAGGAPNASSLTSWRLNRRGELSIVDPTVPTLQSAACWVVITPDGQFAYTSNTGSNTISGFRVRANGRLVPLDAGGVTASTGAGPIDLALNAGGRVLYSLNGGGRTIDAFRVLEDGALETLTSIGGLPAGANGLAVR